MTSKRITSGLLALLMTASMLPADMSVTAAGDKTTLTPTNSSGGLTITLKIKAEITPTVTIADWQYKGTPSTPEVTGNEGNGAVTYKYKVKGADDSTYTETVPTAQGEYTVKADIAETDDYKAGSATADFNIKPYTTGLTITLKIKETIEPTVTLADWTYGKTASTPVVTGNTGSGAVTYKYKAKNADDSTYTAAVPTTPGEYTVKAEIAETAEYKSGEATADFTINKADLTNPCVSITGWTYGDTPNAPSVSGNSGNGVAVYQYKVKGADDSTYSTKVPTDAGEYTVKAIIPDTGNYNGGTATADFTIAKKALTITAESKSKTYGESDPELTFTSSGMVDGDTITGALTRVAGENVGTYAISQGTLTAGDNYDISFTGASFTIDQAEITITADDKVSTYGGDLVELTCKISGAYVEGDDLGIQLTTEASNTANAGEYAITVAYDNDNYDATLVEGKYFITKADLTVTVSGYSGVYDAQPHGITVDTGKSDAVVYYGTEELTADNYATAGSTENPQFTDAGEYTVFYFISTGNYDPQPISGSKEVVISKADTITSAPTANKLTYNRKAQALVKAGTADFGKMVYAVTTSKDKAPEDSAFSASIPTATNAGTYYVWYKATGDKNHNGTGADAVTVKISRRSIKDAKVMVRNKTYTGKALKPGSKVVVDGVRLKNGRDYNITYKNNTKVGRGSAVIMGKGNYEGRLTAKFDVRPKKPTVSEVSSPAAKKLKVSWSSVPQATGYNIKVSTNKNFKGKLTRNVWTKKSSVSAKTFSGIPSGRTYYVKIRAYKKVGSGRVYGEYSKVYKIKVQ